MKEKRKRQFEERPKLALQNDFEEQLQQAADNEVLAAQLELESDSGEGRS